MVGHTDLSGSLVKTQLVPQLLLANRTWCIDLVAQNEERYLVQRFDRYCFVTKARALTSDVVLGKSGKQAA